MHKYAIVVPQLHLVSTCFLSDRFVDPILYTSMHSVDQAFPSSDSGVSGMDIEGVDVAASLGTYVS